MVKFSPKKYKLIGDVVNYEKALWDFPADAYRMEK
jgi:hypothetical protein